MHCTCWILLANSLISFVRASHKMIHWLFSYSIAVFAFFAAFCCFSLAFVVVAVATALVELVLLNRPACLLGCLVFCCCCFPCFPRVLRLVTLGALQTLTSQPVCFYTPPCVSTSVPFDCESSANRAYIPVKLILHGHKRFVARF